MAENKKGSIIETLKNIWKGQVSKRVFLVYFILVFSIYMLGIVVAAAVYPGGFTMEDVYVSYLGGYPNNPRGYIFYNVCEIITGILLVPLFLYMYRRFQPDMKLLNILSCFFGIIGALGFGSIGIWHQGVQGNGHSITTWFAFGGFGISAFFMLIQFLRKIYKKHPWPKLWHVILVYALMFLVLGITLSFTEKPEWFASWNLKEVYIKDRFWEWFYLLVIIIWVWGIFLITPSKDQK
jgi:hypothetical protein